MIAKTFAQLSDLALQVTSHNIGRKRVFLNDRDTSTALTQFSYGELSKNEIVEPHLHASMEEYYYFIAGTGIFTIGEEALDVTEGVFIRVPFNTLHSLSPSGEADLQFIYFGIAV